MRSSGVLALSVLSLLSVTTWAAEAVAAPSGLVGFDHGHTLWSQVLATHVRALGARSTVNYAALTRDRATLSAYLMKVEAVTDREFSDFSPDQRLAFLINAYNALTVKLVLDHYPIKSIRDLGGLFSSPWKKTFSGRSWA